MPDNADWYHAVSPFVEKIDVLSRLAPVLESDEELAWVLSTLLLIIGDYTGQLRRVLNELATASPGEEASA
jgi:hypothetical protein